MLLATCQEPMFPPFPAQVAFHGVALPSVIDTKPNGTIGTDRDAQSTGDATRRVHTDDSLRIAEDHLFRTFGHALGIVTLLARDDDEITLDPTVHHLFHTGYRDGAEIAGMIPMFHFAGDLATLASPAPVDVDHKVLLHA
jgi:hypothetical protein